MNKIPTLFVRDENDRAHVTREVAPGCEWVMRGEGTATRKYDGACFMFDGFLWWSRREVKAGKLPPPGFVKISTDDVTGKTMGWEPAHQSSFAKFWDEAMGSGNPEPEPGTYELIGPKVNGNPEGASAHLLVAHADAQELDVPRLYQAIEMTLKLRVPPIEGLVFHHPDGRMAKIKTRDFGAS